ncbi:MAG: hypothetical protein JWQ35_958 [Bacteriovoracaceae bacterium]|nr:hypothetical protein [Bacteriovoracaceae bacterium]
MIFKNIRFDLVSTFFIAALLNISAVHSQPYTEDVSPTARLNVAQNYLRPKGLKDEHYREEVLEAVKLIDEVRNQFPIDRIQNEISIRAQLLSAESQSTLGNHQIAMNLLSDLLRVDGKNFLGLVERAHERIEINQITEAEDDLSYALKVLLERWSEHFTERGIQNGNSKIKEDDFLDQKSHAFQNLETVRELTDRASQESNWIRLAEYDKEFPDQIRSLVLNLNMLGKIYLSADVDKLTSREIIGEQILESAMKILEKHYHDTTATQNLAELMPPFVIYRSFAIRIIDKLNDKIRRYSLYLDRLKAEKNPAAAETEVIVNNNIELRKKLLKKVKQNDDRLDKLIEQWRALREKNTSAHSIQ